jgi:hypothetical protein
VERRNLLRAAATHVGQADPRQRPGPPHFERALLAARARHDVHVHITNYQDRYYGGAQ